MTHIDKVSLEFFHSVHKKDFCAESTVCTLFAKRNTSLIHGFFLVTLGQGQLPRVMSSH